MHFLRVDLHDKNQPRRNPLQPVRQSNKCARNDAEVQLCRFICWTNFCFRKEEARFL